MTNSEHRHAQADVALEAIGLAEVTQRPRRLEARRVVRGKGEVARVVVVLPAAEELPTQGLDYWRPQRVDSARACACKWIQRE